MSHRRRHKHLLPHQCWLIMRGREERTNDICWHLAGCNECTWLMSISLEYDSFGELLVDLNQRWLSRKDPEKEPPLDSTC
ncbi:MAG TPA: hypothetical protein VFO86_06765 [Terriglobia bacterium]|nr:hypothetical protein [Terriglobia bacterium]